MSAWWCKLTPYYIKVTVRKTRTPGLLEFAICYSIDWLALTYARHVQRVAVYGEGYVEAGVG